MRARAAHERITRRLQQGGPEFEDLLGQSDAARRRVEQEERRTFELRALDFRLGSHVADRVLVAMPGQVDRP